MILTKVGGRLLNNGSVLSVGVVAGFLLVVVSLAFPQPARAAWVNSTGTQFQVGGLLPPTPIIPFAVGTTFADPTCGSQGGTSLAIVQTRKLAGVDPALAVLDPLVLLVSCLDSGGSTASATIRARLNFISPNDGKVLKQLSTSAVPSSGWVHLVNRPDKGDLLGCGNDGSIYSIDYSQLNSTPDGTATRLTSFPSAATSCKGLAWDAENDMIYLGLSVGSGSKIGRVVRFKEGLTTLDRDFTNLPCAGNSLALSGGVLLMSCDGTLNILRLYKDTGASLGVFPSLTATGLPSLSPEPGLGDFACDPVTFQKDATGKDLYRDALWSRRGNNGNGVVALEFPAYTCGMPSSSVVVQSGVPFSPLAAGLSAPGPNGPGQLPKTPSACFDNGTVKDADGDGLPDCWETSGIDFDGDGTIDLPTLCAQVNTNGDGVTFTTECAATNQKDLFVEVAWMQHHKPDPRALSQTQIVQTVGVQSVREAFGAAPVVAPVLGGQNGIKIHIRVDGAPVTFTNLNNTSTSHACYVAFTPCTGLAGTAPNPGLNLTCLGASDAAADYDAIKAANFGRFNPADSPTNDSANPPPLSDKAKNAKQLAFRYVLFAHNLVGNPSGGSNSSGCSEVGGDDAVVSLGSFVTTIVNNVSHGRGTTVQQAGTFMHEFGHLLGLQHGGEDDVNCKPNYRSVMSYSRQFDNVISGRRLDYSRAEDPDLNGLIEGSLDECEGIGSDASLAPIPGRNPGDAPFFPSADQIAFGPGALSVVTPRNATLGNCTSGFPINWNRINVQGKTYQTPPQTLATGDINAISTAACDGSGTFLSGFNDWASLLYRSSAGIDFGSGARSGTPFPPGSSEMTKEDETAFFGAADLDGNGIGDGQDCGTAVAGQTTAPVVTDAPAVPIGGGDPETDGFAPAGKGFLGPTPATLDDFAYTGTDTSGFAGVAGVDLSWPINTRVLATLLCPTHQCGTFPNGTPFLCNTHRIDIKPSAALPKVINLGSEANVAIAIFSEVNWDAPAEIKVDAESLEAHPLTFTVGGVTVNVKTNSSGAGTCSVSDVADPITGDKDGRKDLKCQFPTGGLPVGTNYGVVSGSFLDPLTNQFTAFRARQELTILP